MPAPKKKIMGKGESIVGGVARGGTSRGGSARKPMVKVKPKPNTKAEPRSNVIKRRSVRSEEDRVLGNKLNSRIDTKSGKRAKDAAREIENYNISNPKLKQPTKKIK